MALSDYKTALVTGASSGIGSAVVRALAKKGITVHAAARRAERLAHLAEETNCIAHVVDVRDRVRVDETLGTLEIDILVNNAGVGPGFDQGYRAKPENVEAMLETNVAGPMHVLTAIVPGMERRGRGHIVNIGSIAGLYPMKSSIYGASKAALHLLSQNLRIELQGTGIRVTEICPGQTETEFFVDAFEDAQAEEDYVDWIGEMALLRPDDIAGAILYALDTPWHVNVSVVEITPTEQAPGGLSNVLVSRT